MREEYGGALEPLSTKVLNVGRKGKKTWCAAVDPFSGVTKSFLPS